MFSMPALEFNSADKINEWVKNSEELCVVPAAQNLENTSEKQPSTKSSQPDQSFLGAIATSLFFYWINNQLAGLPTVPGEGAQVNNNLKTIFSQEIENTIMETLRQKSQKQPLDALLTIQQILTKQLKKSLLIQQWQKQMLRGQLDGNSFIKKIAEILSIEVIIIDPEILTEQSQWDEIKKTINTERKYPPIILLQTPTTHYSALIYRNELTQVPKDFLLNCAEALKSNENTNHQLMKSNLATHTYLDQASQPSEKNTTPASNPTPYTPVPPAPLNNVSTTSDSSQQPSSFSPININRTPLTQANTEAYMTANNLRLIPALGDGNCATNAIAMALVLRLYWQFRGNGSVQNQKLTQLTAYRLPTKLIDILQEKYNNDFTLINTALKNQNFCEVQKIMSLVLRKIFSEFTNNSGQFNSEENIFTLAKILAIPIHIVHVKSKNTDAASIHTYSNNLSTNAPIVLLHTGTPPTNPGNGHFDLLEKENFLGPNGENAEMLLVKDTKVQLPHDSESWKNTGEQNNLLCERYRNTKFILTNESLGHFTASPAGAPPSGLPNRVPPGPPPTPPIIPPASSRTAAPVSAAPAT